MLMWRGPPRHRKKHHHIWRKDRKHHQFIGKTSFFYQTGKLTFSTAGFEVHPSVERNKTTPEKTRWRVLKCWPYRKGRKWKRPACFEIVIYFINNFMVLRIFQNGLCLASGGIFMLRHYISQSCNIAPLLLSDVYTPNPQERGAWTSSSTRVSMEVIVTIWSVGF